jgi:hypothetical protein
MGAMINVVGGSFSVVRFRWFVVDGLALPGR